MENDDKTQKFRELLDSSYMWPDYYEFKFIVKLEDKDLILVNLDGFIVTEHLSKQGNYVSLTARKLMKSTQEIIEVYELMSKIKGVISL